MNDPFELQADAWQACLTPAMGGSFAKLTWNGIPILRSAPAQQVASARDSACFPLVPYSSRLRQGTLAWHGSTYRLRPLFDAEPHTLHGVGWQRGWQAVHEQATATLRYSHLADEAWPFAFDAAQQVSLSSQGVEVTMTVTNRSGHEAPMGLGWHPYFVKRPGSHLSFGAAQRWQTDREQLPVAPAPDSGLDTACAELDVNHCFGGWAGVAVLRDSELQIRLSSDLQYLVVSTNPGKGFIAVEPVSHVSDAFRHNDAKQRGMRVLGPGEATTARMRIEAMHAA